MNSSTPLDQCYCLLNRRGSRYLSRLYDRHLAPAEINSSQFSLLSMLKSFGKSTAAELADAMMMERTTLVRALQPLQKEGWIKTCPGKNCRALELSLSTEGKRKVTAATKLWANAQKEFEAEFGKENAQALRTALLKIGSAT